MKIQSVYIFSNTCYFPLLNNLILTFVFFFRQSACKIFHKLNCCQGLVWASPAHHCTQPSSENPTILLCSQLHFFLLTRAILNRVGSPAYILPIENRNRRPQGFFFFFFPLLEFRFLILDNQKVFSSYQALWAEQCVFSSICVEKQK